MGVPWNYIICEQEDPGDKAEKYDTFLFHNVLLVLH